MRRYQGAVRAVPAWLPAGLCEPGGVPEFSDLSLLPFCAGLTLLGLIGTWAVAKRRGVRAGVRGVALSLLPVSLYLTGLLELVWDVVEAAVDWVVHLALSPSVWAGLALLGVSVVLFLASGALRGRSKAAKDSELTGSAAGELTATGPKPAAASSGTSDRKADRKADRKSGRKQAARDEAGEFDEIEEILKRHGIS